MKISKSQKLDQQNQTYRSFGRFQSRIQERDVMTGSAQLKQSPQSRTLQFLKRLRDGWGMIFLTVLLSVYLTGFYHHASDADIAKPADAVIHATRVRDSAPQKSYLLVPTSTEYHNSLPGSVKSTSRTFEDNNTKKVVRDSNTLPGAIGLDGAFDDIKEKTFPTPVSADAKTTAPATKTDVTPTPDVVPTASDAVKNDGSSSGKGAVNSETLNSSDMSQSTGDSGGGSENGSKAKKRRKKKRKKRSKSLEDAHSASPADSTNTTDPQPKKRKKRKGVRKGKRKGKKGFDVAADVNSEESSATSSETSNKPQQKKGSESASAPASESGSLHTTANSEAESSSSENGVKHLYDGPRPMDRKMEELQVPGGTGTLEDEAVKGYYGKLVTSYLAPFAQGISRGEFFNVLRRRTYSLSPPGSNKGVQTILFQLIKKKVFLMDPYEVMKNSKPFYKTRVNELIWLLSEIVKSGKVPDTEFLVAIHDCVQTVDADHTFRGAVYKENNPTFTIVSCNFSDNIPIPMWEGDPVRGGLKSWDKKMERYKGADKTAWAEKMNKAVFRGGNRPSMYFKDKKVADSHCDDAGRSRLNFLGKAHPDLFDVSVSGRWCGRFHRMTPLSETDHHLYKYILYAEGNCFWADRLNKQVFGPSAILKQETPCGQFWEPLLKPMVHYIPTDFFFRDTVEKIKWAKENDEAVEGMVKNANEFAGNFLSEKGIKIYVEVLLTEYTKLLKDGVGPAEKGSRDVTV